ncbi:unannotated protein [freshwater metagenome]|uniref:Unannotated protein n=1 Tax=freshwater metagenome TaxID=449393 RepID=A0A6J7RWR7_9ZZZZ
MIKNFNVVSTNFGHGHVGPKSLRVIDQTIDSAKFFNRGRHQGFNLVAFVYVNFDAQIRNTQFGQLAAGAGHLLGVPFGDNNVGTGFAEVVGHTAPDALAGAGDDDGAAQHRVHRLSGGRVNFGMRHEMQSSLRIDGRFEFAPRSDGQSLVRTVFTASPNGFRHRFDPYQCG